jgi:hypothetical protein
VALDAVRLLGQGENFDLAAQFKCQGSLAGPACTYKALLLSSQPAVRFTHTPSAFRLLSIEGLGLLQLCTIKSVMRSAKRRAAHNRCFMAGALRVNICRRLVIGASLFWLKRRQSDPPTRLLLRSKDTGMLHSLRVSCVDTHSLRTRQRLPIYRLRLAALRAARKRQRNTAHCYRWFDRDASLGFCWQDCQRRANHRMACCWCQNTAKTAVYETQCNAQASDHTMRSQRLHKRVAK